MNAPKKKSLFISYSSDSDAHASQVLQFVEKLEQAGFECWLDQKVTQTSLSEGLDKWMNGCLIKADYVLVVFSKRYNQLVHGESAHATSASDHFESVLSYGDIYQSIVLNKKVIPLVLDPQDEAIVPEPLADRRIYVLEQDQGDLIEALHSNLVPNLPESIPIPSVPEWVQGASEKNAASQHTSQSQMSSMEDLLSASEMKVLVPKTLIEGTVVEVSEDKVWVDVGTKAPGWVAKQEFFEKEGIEIGSAIEVYVEKVEGIDALPVLSFDKARQIRAWETLSAEGREGSQVQGYVLSATQRGLVVHIGVQCFLPASQVDVRFVNDLQSYVGQTLDLAILKIDRDRRHVVVSRRVLLEEKRARRQREFFDNCKVGDVLSGRVSSVMDFGVFVDLDGIDGLVPIGELSYKRVAHPKEVIALGERVRVKVKSIDEARLKIGLSLRDAMANPWEDAASRFEVGCQVKGEVCSLQPFGAFVELEPGIEGLIHVSEFSWTERVEHADRHLKLGEVVSAVVISLDVEAQKIGLSLKRLDQDPWDEIEALYKLGSKVTGTITRLASFGAFVEISNQIEGLVHISQIQEDRVERIENVLKVGQKVEARVVKLDKEERRIGLSLKAVDMEMDDFSLPSSPKAASPLNSLGDLFDQLG